MSQPLTVGPSSPTGTRSILISKKSFRVFTPLPRAVSKLTGQRGPGPACPQEEFPLAVLAVARTIQGSAASPASDSAVRALKLTLEAPGVLDS